MASAPGINSALLRYRVMAFVVGTGLLVLCLAVILKYVPAFDDPHPVEVVGPIHGFLFMLYVLATLDLGFRARWSMTRIVLVALAGTIPFVSFWAEHEVVGWVRRTQQPTTVEAARG